MSYFPYSFFHQLNFKKKFISADERLTKKAKRDTLAHSIDFINMHFGSGPVKLDLHFMLLLTLSCNNKGYRGTRMNVYDVNLHVMALIITTFSKAVKEISLFRDTLKSNPV